MAPLKDADPIVFDSGAADDLAAKFAATAKLLREHIPQRDSLATAARRDWRGAYEMKFGARMKVCAADADALAEALDVAAKQVRDLAARAEAEQARRTKAREWKVEHDAWKRKQDSKSGLDHVVDFVTGHGHEPEPKQPNLNPDDEPKLPLMAPTLKSRA